MPERVPCLVVGMPRAGSTWLMRALNCHPDIAALGETCYWGRGFVQPASDGYYHREQLDTLAKVLKTASFETVVGRSEPGWLQNLTEETLLHTIDSTLQSLATPVSPGEAFTSLCSAIMVAEGKIRWVEKTPHHIMWTDRILCWLPHTRFIVTIRDPFEFMLSYKHTRGMSSKDAQMLETLYHPVACALVYRAYARVAMRLVQDLPNQVLLVRLDQIKGDGAEVMDQILRLCEFEPYPKHVMLPPPAYSSFTDGERPHLAASERFWAAMIGGPSARALGYEVERPGFFGSGSYRHLLTFPLWAFRTFQLMSTRVEGGAIAYLWRWLFPTRALGTQVRNNSGKDE